MCRRIETWRLLTALLFIGLWSVLPGLAATERLVWDKQRDRVDAEISSWPVGRLLQNVAAVTGWQIYVEPGSRHIVSTKFKGKTPGEALRLLLGDLNFALIPQHDSPPKLFVFRTTLQQATELIEAKAKPEDDSEAKPIPNQLVVRVKPGTNIEELAKELGAKVIGRIDGLNAYLLEFPDEESANRARETLKTNENVTAIESNYPISRPVQTDPLALGFSHPLTLRPKAGSSDRIIVGLIDTAIQRGNPAVDPFLLPSINVAKGGQTSENTPTHATSMAETILRGSSLVLGDNSLSKILILPVNVYGDSPYSSTWAVGNGIYEAINAGAKIINLSLGYTAPATGAPDYTSLLASIIKSGHDQGVIFFAAAGNEPVPTPTIPAAYKETVAVTATDKQNNIASYANYGDFVDTGAPGLSMVNFNGQAFIIMGTSPATALTSGMAAGYVDKTGQSYLDAEAAIRKSRAIRPQVVTSGKQP